jgi:hypothetical protein
MNYSNYLYVRPQKLTRMLVVANSFIEWKTTKSHKILHYKQFGNIRYNFDFNICGIKSIVKNNEGFKHYNKD